MTTQSHDSGCVFCRIIRGEIPALKVLETEHAVAFLDINPINVGHVLLVPRVHHANLTELPEVDAARVGALLPALVRAVCSVVKAEAFNVVINNGTLAGQTVFHGHWHIIPRFAGDPVHWPWPHGQKQTQEALSQIQADLREALAPAAAND